MSQDKRFIAVMAMQDAPHAAMKKVNNSNSAYPMVAVAHFKSDHLLAIRLDNHSMEPNFNAGDVAIMDGEPSPKLRNYIVVHLPLESQTVLRQYSESNIVESTILYRIG